MLELHWYVVEDIIQGQGNGNARVDLSSKNCSPTETGSRRPFTKAVRNIIVKRAVSWKSSSVALLRGSVMTVRTTATELGSLHQCR